MYHYYYRNDPEEVIIQVIDNKETPLSIRVTEDDGQTTALVNLPESEIDRMITALKRAKERINPIR